MAKTIISVDRISKMYDLGLVGTGTLARDLNRAWARMRNKPDPYATLAEINNRTEASLSGSVWALRGVSFNVAEGEVLGIIGKNGAGKSTLLKILSQITAPTEGDVKIKGRVASLLEVGTGMHPEMTARQNIYLNGSIMGMSRMEISNKFDEIVDFAGINKYVDTPTKRFSSGMQVRLGFAVAAFLEPEILIVDEVLAVGDAEFQRKAIGKMQDVSSSEGRTVLFVSHNMTAVRSFCTSTILLENGEVVSRGASEDVISTYLQNKLQATCRKIGSKTDDLNIEVETIEAKGEYEALKIEDDLYVSLSIRVFESLRSKYNFNIIFSIGGDEVIFESRTEPQSLVKGRYKVEYKIPKNILNNILYTIHLVVVHDSNTNVLIEKDALTIEMKEEVREGGWMGRRPGRVRPKMVEAWISPISN